MNVAQIVLILLMGVVIGFAIAAIIWEGRRQEPSYIIPLVKDELLKLFKKIASQPHKWIENKPGVWNHPSGLRITPRYWKIEFHLKDMEWIGQTRKVEIIEAFQDMLINKYNRRD